MHSKISFADTIDICSNAWTTTVGGQTIFTRTIFGTAPSVVRDFASVDMRKVTDYILLVESVCLDAKTGAVIRAPYRNEFEIHVGP